ncbi:hypothetical protein [Litoreibacter halocynthiae]|uniref:hypothetical protein n=1 Tax=Litoreibacter halocynthiae TaxID=1242689 RepID=UPI00248F4B36|nr:hypothetical protein [Litoreibacter halocynthiae]
MGFFNFNSLIAFAILTSVPSVSLADRMIISDAALCGTSEETVLDAGGFIMSETTIEAIEFLCEFDQLPQLDLKEHQTLTRKGYCAGPMFLIPQVFAFRFGEDIGDIEMIGQFAQYVPSGRITFHVCE